MTDGERLPLAVKELGSCDLYPQVRLTLCLDSKLGEKKKEGKEGVTRESAPCL